MNNSQNRPIKAYDIARDANDAAELAITEVVVSKPAMTELRYHYGPTEADNDYGKKWCYDCRGEVFWIDGSHICMGCGRTEQEGQS